MERGSILVVDDEASARSALSEILTDEGYSVRTAPDGFRALQAVTEEPPDVVVTDLKMPGMDGLALLQRVQIDAPGCAVILMTAFGAVETAVRAMREGASDYVTKPLNSDELIVVIERCLDRVRIEREAQRLRRQLSERYHFDNIVGSSAEMQSVFKCIAQVAPSRATVLVTGESGTGKELVAAAIHHRSDRANRPFIKLHCAALAETLLESELFGHERGAFTGAVRQRVGRFEQAAGGTLFLDEIGEISSSMQVKLLRVLQEHAFERVGGNQTLKVDVRVVAATNRDLEQMVREGKFREDLYYRLNVINLHLPPLRERTGDIGTLAMHFLEKYATENHKTISRFDPDALRVLLRHRWPGNVRELENVVERTVVLADGDSIALRYLPAALIATSPSGDDRPVIPGSTLAEIERHAILETLAQVGGSTTKAAKILGISVRKIQYRLHEYADAPRSNVPAVESGTASK